MYIYIYISWLNPKKVGKRALLGYIYIYIYIVLLVIYIYIISIHISILGPKPRASLPEIFAGPLAHRDLSLCASGAQPVPKLLQEKPAWASDAWRYPDEHVLAFAKRIWRIWSSATYAAFFLLGMDLGFGFGVGFRFPLILLSEMERGTTFLGWSVGFNLLFPEMDLGVGFWISEHFVCDPLNRENPKCGMFPGAEENRPRTQADLRRGAGDMLNPLGLPSPKSRFAFLERPETINQEQRGELILGLPSISILDQGSGSFRKTSGDPGKTDPVYWKERWLKKMGNQPNRTAK